jgi:hypothetical protein
LPGAPPQWAYKWPASTPLCLGKGDGSKKPPQDPGQLAEELMEIVIVLENE